MTSTLLIIAVYSRCVNMNLVFGLALHEFTIAQWIERLPSNWQVIGSSPVADSSFSLSSCTFFVARFFVPFVDCLLSMYYLRTVCWQMADRFLRKPLFIFTRIKFIPLRLCSLRFGTWKVLRLNNTYFL